VKRFSENDLSGSSLRSEGPEYQALKSILSLPYPKRVGEGQKHMEATA